MNTNLPHKESLNPVNKLCVAALLLAIGIVLPQTLHLLGGRVSGSVLLPMHLPVFVAGMLLGARYGVAIGIATPIASFFITGMPGFARLPFMVIELAAYGLVSGLLGCRRINVYVALIAAQICGRIAYGCAHFAALGLFGMNVRPLAAVSAAFVAGLPGIAIQLVLVPAIVVFARKRIKRMDLHGKDARLAAGRKASDEA